jgi:hypothetical protein
MTLLILFSIGLVALSGLIVIALGDWHHLGLKFAGVALSTMSGVGLLALGLQHPGVVDCAQDKTIFIGFSMCVLLRNVSAILFHIAAGRDAIKIKDRDRRTACQMNLKQPLILQPMQRKR